MPLGPLMLVVGVWSSKPNDSIFLVALVASLVPLTPNVFAVTSSLRLPVTVKASVQVARRGRGATGAERGVEVVRGRAPGDTVVLQVALGVAVLDLDLHPADAAGRLGRAGDRERRARPATTRPSIGVVIVVSVAVAAGSWCRGRRTRPGRCGRRWSTCRHHRRTDHATVAIMALLPSNEFEPAYHSLAVPVTGSSSTEVVTTDDLVAETVAGQALAGAVADVVEAGPRRRSRSATR